MLNIPSLAGHIGAQASAIRLGIAFHDLHTGHELLFNENETFHPASTIKVPVMMEVYRQAAAGKFDLDSRIPVHNTFVSIADGQPFSVHQEDDADEWLYEEIGKTIPIHELVERMITLSSNLATNLLVELVTPEAVTDLITLLGAKNVALIRGMDDTRAYHLKINNRASAGGLKRLLQCLAAGEVVSKQASREMIGILLRQHYNEGIPAGLPQGIPVAHKTGWIEGIYHDAAIVYPPDRLPYVLVVMTQGYEDHGEAHREVASISRDIFQAVIQP